MLRDGGATAQEEKLKKPLLGSGIAVASASIASADTYRSKCFAPAPGTSQKVVADVLATHGAFDAVVSHHGSAGSTNEMQAAGHHIVPKDLEGEDGQTIFITSSDKVYRVDTKRRDAARFLSQRKGASS